MRARIRIQIGPKHFARHHSSRVQQVMVIVPVDTNVRKAQDVTEKGWHQRPQVG